MNIEDIVALSPVIPVLTLSDLGHAVPLARALLAGGLRVLEVSLRTSVATQCIASIRAALPAAVMGVGALTRPADFAIAGQAGAHFGVSPGLTPELAGAARGARFPLLPGVMTPTDVIAARHAGYHTLKFFPAEAAGGPAVLRSLGALFPDVMFCPTGGITLANAADYLALTNVVSVAGSWIAPPDMVRAGNWDGIEALAREAATLKT